jgi:hypothetical protein
MNDLWAGISIVAFIPDGNNCFAGQCCDKPNWQAPKSLFQKRKTPPALALFLFPPAQNLFQKPPDIGVFFFALGLSRA